MAGVEGNKGGGRKPAYVEKVRTAVINKCWDFLLEEMENPNISPAIKREIALRLAPKNIPQDVTIESTGFEIKIK